MADRQPYDTALALNGGTATLRFAPSIEWRVGNLTIRPLALNGGLATLRYELQPDCVLFERQSYVSLVHGPCARVVWVNHVLFFDAGGWTD